MIHAYFSQAHESWVMASADIKLVHKTEVPHQNIFHLLVNDKRHMQQYCNVQIEIKLYRCYAFSCLTPVVEDDVSANIGFIKLIYGISNRCYF